MTGLVKEEILTRQAELGYTIQQGRLKFDFLLLDPAEFLTEAVNFAYLDVNGKTQQVLIPTGSLVYTICQVPVLLQTGGQPGITIFRSDGSSQQIAGHELDQAASQRIFKRTGEITRLIVQV